MHSSTARLTWQAPPQSSALPIVAYVVERAVGALDGVHYTAAGRSEGARFEQRVDDLAGQSVIYRVRAEDEGGNRGPWCESNAIHVPEVETSHRFQAYIVMACIAMACIVMPYVTACIVVPT